MLVPLFSYSGCRRNWSVCGMLYSTITSEELRLRSWEFLGLAPTTNFLLWSLVYYVTTMINSSWLVNIKCASSYEVAFFLLSIRALKTSLHEFPILGCKYFLLLNCNLQLKRVYYNVYPIITKLRKEKINKIRVG